MVVALFFVSRRVANIKVDNILYTVDVRGNRLKAHDMEGIWPPSKPDLRL
jgi:hypothetical protein